MPAVIIPSISAIGSWVIANIAKKTLNEAITPPIAAGNARASWIEVVTYVAISPRKEAIVRFLNNHNSKKAVNLDRINKIDGYDFIYLLNFKNS